MNRNNYRTAFSGPPAETFRALGLIEQNGILYAKGDPYKRFRENGLLVLRTVRLACEMGFSFDAQTNEALERCAHYLEDIAQESIGQEMDGILATGHVGWALRNVPNVMCNAIPELADMVGFDQRTHWHAYDVLEHTVRVCNAVEAFTVGLATQRLRWAAMLHDIGKPATLSLDQNSGGHFYGHAILSSIMAGRIMRRLGLPANMVRGSVALVRFHDHIVQPTARSMRRVLVMMEEADPGNAAPLAHELMDLKRGDAVSKAAKASWYAVELDKMDKLLREEELKGAILGVKDLLIDGNDVCDALGIDPGPRVGMALCELLQSVVDNE
ncbi:MAG: HD domain-containing protein, partial [Coriobacteriales bacterium]|nr:HD domain-containing protein [Coriobacteriales bacterium]